jgi:hypothetical protein
VSRPFESQEPGADYRQLARMLRQMHVALVQEGFTEIQALEMTGRALAAIVAGAQGHASDGG